MRTLIATFGHMNFKAVCRALDLDPKECKGLYTVKDLKGCYRDNSRVLVAPTACHLSDWVNLEFEIKARGLPAPTCKTNGPRGPCVLLHMLS